MIKYKFTRQNWKSDKVLICTGCLETLFRDDIEHFATCPYCNHKIDFDIDIEDYLLKPVVDRWVAFQHFTSNELSKIM